MPALLPDFPCWIYFRDGTGVIVRNLEDFHQKACHYDINSDEWIPREWADTPAKFANSEEDVQPIAEEVLPFVEKPSEDNPAQESAPAVVAKEPKKRGRPPKK